MLSQASFTFTQRVSAFIASYESRYKTLFLPKFPEVWGPKDKKYEKKLRAARAKLWATATCHSGPHFSRSHWTCSRCKGGFLDATEVPTKECRFCRYEVCSVRQPCKMLQYAMRAAWDELAVRAPGKTSGGRGSATRHPELTCGTNGTCATQELDGITGAPHTPTFTLYMCIYVYVC